MTAVTTKVVRVHLAGGVAVDVHVPSGTVLVLDAVVTRALELARRTFALVGDPLVVRLDASQALPGDVAQPRLAERVAVGKRLPARRPRRSSSSARSKLH